MEFQDKTLHYIYIIECNEGKYYVGRTTNPKSRFNQHINKSGSAWTKKYGVNKVLYTIRTINQYSELIYTLECMQKYGIDNVRGGPFCQLTFTEDDYKTINLLINSLKNCACFNCGDTTHTIDACKVQPNYDNIKCEFILTVFYKCIKKYIINKIILRDRYIILPI